MGFFDSIASAAGGMFDLGFGIYDRIYQKSQNDRAADAARNQFKLRVQDARDLGINPLAALGMPGSTPSFSVGGSTPHASFTNKKESQLLDAQINEVNARAKYYNSLAEGASTKKPSSKADLDSVVNSIAQKAVQTGKDKVLSYDTPFGGKLYRDPKNQYSSDAAEKILGDAAGFLDILNLLDDYLYTGGRLLKTRRKYKNRPKAAGRPRNKGRYIPRVPDLRGNSIEFRR